MKNIRKYIGAALLSFALGSCHVADVSEYASLSDVSWYLSYDSTVIDTETLNQKITLSANGRLSMMDLSQGMNSHQWVVQEDESIKFLEGALSSYSPTTEEIEAMVVDHAYTTSDKTIQLWFTEAGDFTVKLINRFPYEAGFTYNNPVDWRDITVTADEVNGEWVWEETFSIKVYSSSLTPEVKVYRDAELTDEVELGTPGVTEVIADEENGVEGVEGVDAVPTQVILGLGETLYFQDATWGDPDSWTWTCDALGETATTQNVAFTFNTTTTSNIYNEETGEYECDSPIKVTFKPGRAANTTLNISSVYSVETLTVPLDILVLDAGDSPIVVEAPVLETSQTLTFKMNNAVFYPTTTLSANNFSLTYFNDYSGTEQTGSISISTVEVGSDGTVTISTASTMYNTDQLQLTYNGPDVTVQYNDNKFTSEIEIPIAETSLNETFFYDFEDDEQLENWQVTLGDSSYTIISLSERNLAIVDDPSGALNEETGEVNRCLMFKTEGSGLSSPLLQEVVGTFTGDVDTYKIYFNFYNTVATTSISLYTRMLHYPYLTNSYIDWGGDWNNFSTTTYGNADIWTSVTGTEIGTKVLENMKITFCPNTYSGVLYVDDIYVTNAATR